MNKKVVCIFICMLLCATVSSVGGIINVDDEIRVFVDLTHNIKKEIMVNSTTLDIQFKGEVFCNSRDDFIDQQQTQNDPAGYNVNYDQSVAQSFKPSVQRLSKVHLNVFKFEGNPDYDLEFSIREQLSGSDLVKVTKTPGGVVNGWNEFDFPDIQVEIDKTYYIVLEGDAGLGGDPIYCWYCKVDGNPYARGMAHIFNYGSWHNVPVSDCCFKTFYTNFAPNKPSISGQTGGKPGTSYDYKFMSSDPDADDIYYYIDWGDDYIETWIGPYGSGEEITRSHTWEEEGNYTIMVKTKDTFNMESDWSELEVNMPRDKAISSSLLLRFLERFPILQKFLTTIRDMLVIFNI